MDKSKGIFVPILFTPKITEQHITGSFVEMFFRKRKSKISSVIDRIKIKKYKKYFLYKDNFWLLNQENLLLAKFQ